MSRFLTVDGGNTLTKYALFDSKFNLIDRALADCSDLLNRHDLSPQNTLVASVHVARPRKALDGFKIYDVSDYFKGGAFLDMPVAYSETLGADRLVLAYNYHNTKQPLVLIDSGTFTTVDLVDSEGFQGGHILPGLEALFDAYDFGYQLKKMRPTELLQKPINLPRNSVEAMASGITRSFTAPIESILSAWSFEKVYITGGNGQKLCDLLSKTLLQRSASIHFDADLLHHGLLKFLLKAAKI